MASKTLIKKLDYVFNKYIRLRDTSKGVFRCCSCGVPKDYSMADAGHFINRKWMATRWREDNVHAQCSSCNRFNEGSGPEYTLFMIDKYGKEHVEYLLALKNVTSKWTDSELKLLIEDYKNKVKDLEENKTFEN